MKKVVLAAITIAMLIPGIVAAHCEIPCGIYDDQLRIDLMREDITTIEKSMTQITSLSAAGDKNYNQIVRWVTNKEVHADKFTEIITQYFMTQRLKPKAVDAEGFQSYQKQLLLLHEMMVTAMKAKQTTDQTNITKLRELVDAFEKEYFAEHKH